ncbi:STAS domain-containing protein [Lapillicoccus jejuensis]|uniref:STAS domain-containing protein n=1 Tax=Lapillicoccus jejuensis TaxID=402171 RepID=UPI001FE582D9|nr:STAS domain-containing protein [Lapillicoccus jejuensis]
MTVTEAGSRLRLVGRLDVVHAADVRAVLLAAVDAGSGDLHVDLADVVLADSTALGLLVEAHRRAQRRGRRLVLVHPQPRTERLLRAARLLPRGRRTAAVDEPALEVSAPVGVVALTA